MLVYPGSVSPRAQKLSVSGVQRSAHPDLAANDYMEVERP